MKPGHHVLVLPVTWSARLAFALAALLLLGCGRKEPGPGADRDAQEAEGESRMQHKARVIIEGEGDTVVYRTETDPPLVSRGKTPREALESLKDKIRAAIKEGTFDGEAWKPFLSRDQLEKFEDVVVDGIGNVKDLENKTVDEVRAVLAPDRYCLYSSITPVPEGWPAEVIDLRIGTDGRISQVWNMDTGEGWQQFYAFGLTTHRDEIKSEPAFIYERKADGGAETCLPVVSLWISPEGRCEKVSKRWCDSVRRQDRGDRSQWCTNEVQAVLRAALAIAAKAGADEIALRDVENAVKASGTPEPQPAQHRPFRFHLDVVSAFREAAGLADARDATAIGIEHLSETLAQFRKGSVE